LQAGKRDYLKLKKYFSYIVITSIVLIFFWKFFLNGFLPIPADTIVGLYHPFRDFYAREYPRGIPFKNFLITDPVRQQIPWKNLVIEMEKKFELPLWNPYSFSGTPFLANFQTGSFYPFNLLFFTIPFAISWSFYIIIAQFLASFFFYFYLRNLKLEKIASVFGAVVFSFSGFAISWIEWGNILHTALWLPLILLSIDKLHEQKLNIKNQSTKVWFLILLLSTVFSFFAGHLQIFFYVLLISFAYVTFRWFLNGKKRDHFVLFALYYLLFIAITAIQWIPTLQFINLSARAIDVMDWRTAGWFIPWQNITQFIAPDFFGNPTTLNYFGVFNYGEFIGYVGVLPLIFAVFSIFKRDKTAIFFWCILAVSFLFAFQNLISELLYRLSIPFISTSQPTRLIFLIDFSLSILAAIGFNHFLKTKEKRKIFLSLSFFSIIFALLWLFVLYFGKNYLGMEDIAVSKRNLILPTILFIISSLTLSLYVIFEKRLDNSKNNLFLVLGLLLLAIVLFDLFRFGWKYISFSEDKYMYPDTEVTKFLQENLGDHRVMATDSRIFPPNFSVMYRIQSVDGYDPLFLQRYAELIAANERGQANISAPFGFNRIITPQHYRNEIVNLLGVKYLLSFSEPDKEHFKKVFSEGETQVYENTNVLPRVFFVEKLLLADNKQEAIDAIYRNKDNLVNVAVVEGSSNLNESWNRGAAKIVDYSENKVVIQTENEKEGFLVLTDSFYPTWKAFVDGKPSSIYLTDFNFRGIIVPSGKHQIVFQNSLL
jgi:hypothetical protein